MKKLLLLLLLVGSEAKAQESYFSAYIPLHTSHFKNKHRIGDAPYRAPIHYHKGIGGSEGGQGGLILSHNTINGNWIKTKSLIAMQNSYGDLISGFAIGRVYKFKKWRLGAEFGAVIGYRKGFQQNFNIKVLDDGNKYSYENDFTAFVIKYNLAPVFGITAAIDITKNAGIKLIVNPLFINVGFNYQFKKRKL